MGAPHDRRGARRGRGEPNLGYACDTHSPWAGEDVVRAPLPFVEGGVPVPGAPGLGVELDRDALARMYLQYVRCRIRAWDDASYPRAIDRDFAGRRADW